MVIFIISCIFPPAASTTAWRLRRACSYWATRSPGALMRPSASLPVCPARKRRRPPVTRIPWLKPEGRARFGGLMIVFPITALPSSELGFLFRFERLIEAAVILAHEHQRLGLGFGFDGGD